MSDIIKTNTKILPYYLGIFYQTLNIFVVGQIVVGSITIDLS